MAPYEFQPSGLLRNPHVQSILASSVFRDWRFRKSHRYLLTNSEEQLLECGDKVRLQGFYTPQPALAVSRGLMVLLHGWEGSAQSGYLLSAGTRLLQEGFDVFRLNFRDHGKSHYLNRELFHSCRILEVVGAIKNLADRHPRKPLALMGFSLGGNFALRAALHAQSHDLPLAKVVAICPAIHPGKILDTLEQGPWFYHAHFMRKWRNSLRRKQALFPDHYAFDRRFFSLRMRHFTAELITRYTEFPSLEAYLDGYSIHGDRLEKLTVPASILTAQDDPIIPIGDFHELKLPESVKLDISPYGGHCGFIRDWSLRSYAEDYLVEELRQLSSPSPAATTRPRST